MNSSDHQQFNNTSSNNQLQARSFMHSHRDNQYLLRQQHHAATQAFELNNNPSLHYAHLQPPPHYSLFQSERPVFGIGPQVSGAPTQVAPKPGQEKRLPIRFWRFDEEGKRKERDREGDQLSLVTLLVTAFRRSLIGCSSTNSANSGRGKLSSMEIGWPSNVRHVGVDEGDAENPKHSSSSKKPQLP